MIPHENQVNHYMTTEAGLNLVRRGGYAFLSDVSAAYMYMQQKFAPNELCDINEVDMRPKVLLGFFAEPKSPYKELLKAKYLYTYICICRIVYIIVFKKIPQVPRLRHHQQVPAHLVAGQATLHGRLDCVRRRPRVCRPVAGVPGRVHDVQFVYFNDGNYRPSVVWRPSSGGD